MITSQSQILPIVEYDPELLPYADHLERRLERYRQEQQLLEDRYGSITNASRGHHYFGFNRGTKAGQPGVWYREWAPGADQLFLMGTFNRWSKTKTPLSVDETGVWSIFLPDDYASRLKRGSLIKVHVVRNGKGMDKIPAYIRQVHKRKNNDYCGVFALDEAYDWQHDSPEPARAPRIYEAHIGMALEKEKVGSFDEFRTVVLPRIKKQGYNCLQLMGIQQHPYYASFGYHVSSFFAVSDYFGSPESLKRLVDEAHGMGIRVLMDIVHSHSVKNIRDGLNQFDGTDHLYFHPGNRGDHPGWDSKVFNYGRPEVVRFLLSNLRYWLEEFRFDGFRFDGISSMVYLDHGFMRSFGGYDDYFDDRELDHDAIAYLQTANSLIKDIAPHAITLAEDVSGMPGMALPIADGGIGFDYRLTMGLPDLWNSHIKHFRDEEWSVDYISEQLTKRRPGEKCIAYAECHDQSIVGDRPLAFQLMKEAMYTDMAIDKESSEVDRGIGLLNLIRFLTFTCGGDGWLNFIGNEFGHPDWVDFPREGNDFSFERAYRKWSLADNPFLRYQFLANFDAALQLLDEQFNLLDSLPAQRLHVNNELKVMAFERSELLFVLNFHPTRSLKDYPIPLHNPSDYRLDLHSDSYEFGGHSRLKTGESYRPTLDKGRPALSLYLPCRTALCLAPSTTTKLSHPYLDHPMLDGS